jgi:2-desacetyl-2-hydroxyethyl bacteriochlorophyllide A dehydrogenase
LAKNPSLIFTGVGQVEIQYREIPAPSAGEVLIKSKRSLISTGTELTLLSGKARQGSVWSSLGAFPRPAGYCNVGEIVGVGEGVQPSLIGQRVASHCPHAAYVSCAAGELRHIPNAVADEDATLNTLAEVVMNGVRRAGLAWGETVAIVGLGLLGQLTARVCAVMGAQTIFGIEISAARLRYLPVAAYFHPLLGAACDLGEAIQGVNGGRLADVVFEVTGNPEVIPDELRLLRTQGRFVILSSPTGYSQFDFHDLCNRESYTIIGAHYFSHPSVATPDNPWTAVRHSEIFMSYLASRRIAVNDLISHRFSYKNASAAYGLLDGQRDTAMGVILEWD